MRTFAAVSLMCLLLPVFVHAQVQLNIDTLDITAYPEVRMKVRVMDGSSAVRGLQVSGFTAFEEGTIMPITAGYCEDTLSRESLAVLLLIDISRSMGPWPWGNNGLVEAKSAAKSFIDRLQAGDSAALVSFSEQAYYDQPWTANMNLVKQKIDDLDWVAGTALWDAVALSANLIRYRTQRRIVILLADGEDNSSTLGASTAISYARDADCTVFTIGLGGEVDETNMQLLANETGGKYYNAPSGADLDEIYSEIAEELQSTGVCEIRYTSPIDCWNGDEVSVEVEVQSESGFGFASTSYTLPYDTTTFSYVNVGMERDYVVEAGESITIPVQLTRVSPNRAPAVFEFSVDFDTELLVLTGATTGTLTAGYTLTTSPTLRGSDVRISGGTAVTTPGELCFLTFEAAPVFSSAKTEIGITPPDVQQFCTIASSDNGLITVSGTCERALGSGGTLQRDALYEVTPNPVTGTALLRYRLTGDRHVILRVVDVMGNEVRRLVDETQRAADHVVRFDAASLSSGQYFVILTTGKVNDVQTLVVTR
jgi:VWFA-related protein